MSSSVKIYSLPSMETYTPEVVFEDYIYYGLYGKTGPDGSKGAGDFWYSKYNSANYPEGYLAADGKMLSPHFKAELDLSVEPFTTFEILPKEMSIALYKNWEQQRPVNRHAEYNIIYSPYCDLTGKVYTLYERPNTTQSLSYSNVNLKFDSESFIHIQREEFDSWSVRHTLFTEDLIITSYDQNFNKQVPSFVQVIDKNTVLVRFDRPTNGVVLLSKSTPSGVYVSPTSIRMRHGLNRREVITQVRDEENTVYFPQDGISIDVNTNQIDGVYPNSQAYVHEALTLTYYDDADDDGVNDVEVTEEVWIFDDVSKITTDYVYEGQEWIAWQIDHPLDSNIFQVNCYNPDNDLVQPTHVLLDELDDLGLPQVTILWCPTDNVNPLGESLDIDDLLIPFLGFAAISPVGDVVSFFGICPIGADGVMMDVEWRLSIETDDEVFTSLVEGSKDAIAMMVGKEDKTIHYFDPYNPDYRPFVSGTTDLEEMDDKNYYYTFTATSEAIEQLGIRDYKIIGVELINNRVKRINRTRIVYSKLSGIYKPEGMNFVTHFRIKKEAKILDGILLDHTGEPLIDNIEEYLYD